MSKRFFKRSVHRSLLGCVTLAAIGFSGCAPEARNDLPARMETKEETERFRPREIGEPGGKQPWIAWVTSVDLDGDGALDVLACEAQENRVLWLRQVASGDFEERVLTADVKAPVQVEAFDVDGDGDLDVMIACMGAVFPNNDRIGAVVVLENRGAEGFLQRTILDNTSRVTAVKAADVNGDGRPDLVLAQFGYDQGEVRWLEQVGPWQFRPHTLLELSGAITVSLADFDGDGRLDIAAQMSQQWEEIYLFSNRGAGRFERSRIWASANEDYGCSGMTVADLNRDGRPDLVFANGDGFGPAVIPGPRPYHGVQWLENRGNGLFVYRRIGDMAGAYNPIVLDLDRDGELDVVAVAAFVETDARQRPVPSLVWFRQQADGSFEKRILAYSPRHLVAVAAGEFGTEKEWSLVTAGFHVFKPAEAGGRITFWERSSP